MTVRARLIEKFVKRWVLYKRSGHELYLHFGGLELERVDPLHPLSGLRIARYMRRDGLVSFACTERNGSKYVLTNVNLAMVNEEMKRKHLKFDLEIAGTWPYPATEESQLTLEGLITHEEGPTPSSSAKE